jgi:hypothetical protein
MYIFNQTYILDATLKHGYQSESQHFHTAGSRGLHQAGS